MKVVGGRTPPERGRSVSDLNSQFLRRAARGGPGRSAGQNRKRGGPGSGGARSETLREPFDAPSGGSDQEMMPRQQGARHTCSRGWSDGPARRWWVVGQGGRTGEGDLGGGVVRQDVIRVQVRGGKRARPCADRGGKPGSRLSTVSQATTQEGAGDHHGDSSAQRRPKRLLDQLAYSPVATR